MSKDRAYWISQAGGWGAYGLIVATYYMYVLGDSLHFGLRELVSILLMCVFGFVITHLFRAVVKYWNWVKLPLIRLIPQVLIANIVMGAAYVTLSSISERVIGISEQLDFQWNIIFVAMSNASLIFLLWSLAYFSMYFFRNYKQEEIERLKWEGAIKDFELNKLRSQLNPHFMFNALNGIRSLVDEDPNRAKTAITQMSNILRNSLLADRAKTVTLGEELRTVNDYLNLEKLRYEERMCVATHIDEGTLGVQVPPMMIQTIVENAIKHGVSKQVSDGFIDLTTYTDKNMLVIEIRNSGNLGQPDSNSTGFGILNTRQRLELIYGVRQATFDILQEKEGVVLAKLQIPTKLQ
ncbi:Histidine kinase [Flexibacter flexilis DSM 6793]|uniref:Histidine kinase n=2 Tax=Flexibacter flexilis TaxID=998 RepID=A0A1I1J4S9_9BACT|nr:Histidine kinase [Flexibacter flexilis DSM 6793]